MKDQDIRHLEWIYNRVIERYGENPNYDYMIRFREITQSMRKKDVSISLPSLDDATKVAVRISEEAITPQLEAKEQALFIAGFQECMKWLNIHFRNAL
jgi:hypothetical protein